MYIYVPSILPSFLVDALLRIQNCKHGIGADVVGYRSGEPHQRPGRFQHSFPCMNRTISTYHGHGFGNHDSGATVPVPWCIGQVCGVLTEE